jgi:hypothetical protein
MPNFAKLAERGVFRPLDTSVPSMSPWRGRRSRPASTRAATASTTSSRATRAPTRRCSRRHDHRPEALAKHRPLCVPLGKARIKLRQKSQHFWKLLGDKNIFSIIQRVPITFPPVPFKNGLLLSGMCVPDLRGSQGTFSFFSTERREARPFVGGEQTVLRRGKGGRSARASSARPRAAALGRAHDAAVHARVRADGAAAARDRGHRRAARARRREYSDWVELPFQAGLGVTVRGSRSST